MVPLVQEAVEVAEQKATLVHKVLKATLVHKVLKAIKEFKANVDYKA